MVVLGGSLVFGSLISFLSLPREHSPNLSGKFFETENCHHTDLSVTDDDFCHKIHFYNFNSFCDFSSCQHVSSEFLLWNSVILSIERLISDQSVHAQDSKEKICLCCDVAGLFTVDVAVLGLCGDLHVVMLLVVTPVIVLVVFVLASVFVGFEGLSLILCGSKQCINPRVQCCGCLEWYNATDELIWIGALFVSIQRV